MKNFCNIKDLCENSELVPESIGNADIINISTGQELVYKFKNAEDFSIWECISFDLKLQEYRTFQADIRVYPIQIGRKEHIDFATASVLVTGQGWTHIQISLSQFDYRHVVSSFWRYICKISINGQFLSGEPEGELLIKNLRLCHEGEILVNSPISSKPGNAEETIEYELNVFNCSDKTQSIVLQQNRYGWETMDTEINPSSFVLDPEESMKCTVRVKIGEIIPQGGFETQKIAAIPNGNSSFKREIEFITVRRLSHPYISLTEQGWGDVRKKIKGSNWAQKLFNEYINTAEKWEVPEFYSETYLFGPDGADNLDTTAYTWKLTGRKEFAEKAALFIKRLCDPDKGYVTIKAPIFQILAVSPAKDEFIPMKPRACDAEGLVKEGIAFMKIAAACDVIYDSGVFTQQDKENIQSAFRLFMETADWNLCNGDCNNHQLAMAIGALFCSQLLQDMKWMKRFIEGRNGIKDILAAGIMDDGWYFECASGYNLLVAELCSKAVISCIPWGINLKDMYFSPYYFKNVLLSPWSMKEEEPFKNDKPFLGMSFEKYGPSTKNFRTIRSLFDSLLPFIDYRGIIFGCNDSGEQKAAEIFDIGYYIYKDSNYVPVIKAGNKRDLLYGFADLPEIESTLCKKSAYADNAGFAVLRSQTMGRTQDEQIQAVIKYGTHGGYHGHYDRTSLLSLMRYGKSFYNTMATWYGYFSFMFKMWVQTSMASNMVVVDQLMQEPAETRRVLFHNGQMLQACAVETIARWGHTPYGGQTPYIYSFPEEKCWNESRSIPVTEFQRAQGEIGEYSEQVQQRRMMLVTDDYVVNIDYLRGNEEHEFDCLYHIKGFKGFEGNDIKYLKHSAQFSSDPYGSGQFVTNCSWYCAKAPVKAGFEYEFTEDGDKNLRNRMPYNKYGVLKMDVHTLWPKEFELVSGDYPEAHPVNKKVWYTVSSDGRILASGKFGAWILGNEEIDIPLYGVKELKLKVTVDKPDDTLKTIFWGDPYIETEDGNKIFISELGFKSKNIDSGYGYGRDYYNGEVKIAGIQYDKAIPSEPLKSDLPAEIIIDVSGLNAKMFKAVVGGDYPCGNDINQRKTTSIRTYGRETSYITIVEAYEGDKKIKNAFAKDKNNIVVELTDGRLQEIRIDNFEENESEIKVSISETNAYGNFRNETTKR